MSRFAFMFSPLARIVLRREVHGKEALFTLGFTLVAEMLQRLCVQRWRSAFEEASPRQVVPLADVRFGQDRAGGAAADRSRSDAAWSHSGGSNRRSPAAA